MQEHKLTVSTSSGEIHLATGKLAKLAHGAVLATKGGTSVLATVTYENNDSDDDFLPLTVEYLEKFYAFGVVSGSRISKREGFPNESAIIKGRQIDHTIRPLFPKGFTRPVNVIIDVMADDQENDPEQLSVFAASAALMLSGIPFAGPASSVIVSVKGDGSMAVNQPLSAHTDDMLGEFAVSAANGKVLNIEGWGKELPEDTMDKLMDLALENIAVLNKAQTDFANQVGVKAVEFTPATISEELLSQIKTIAGDRLAKNLYQDKQERDAAQALLVKELIEQLTTEEAGFSAGQVVAAIDYASKKMMREGVMTEEKRFSGRALDEIRPLSAEVDLLPTVHGSALFNRGLTQSLSITTLAAISKGNILNDRTGEDEIHQFMHHYSFPPYSTGEAGRVRYKPGRREIGHGAIGYNALKNMMPSEDVFPYTVRVVSEILTSNGSTSMAATCAASMSMMAAGVPLKKPVAGIGVGLVTADEAQEKYKLLLDIEGVEDFYGDMDFKVTGTDAGVTAIQFETKLQGVKPEILKQAFRLSQKGRMQVLDVMNAVISQGRENMAPNAPRVEIIQINPEMIGALIGPGGKVIKDIIERGNRLGGVLEVNINDDGKVFISSNNQAQMDFARAEVNNIVMVPEIGETYDAVVASIMPYGVFVDLPGNNSGLVHVSEMSNEYVKDPATLVKQGDKVKVKVVGTERGKLSLSMKQVK